MKVALHQCVWFVFCRFDVAWFFLQSFRVGLFLQMGLTKLMHRSNTNYFFHTADFNLRHMDMLNMVTDKTMQSIKALEYMCPYCGAINDFRLNSARDMYHEQHESCECCNKVLSLTPADGIGGRINLIVDALDTELVIK